MILLDTCILTAYAVPHHPKNEVVINRIVEFLLHESPEFTPVIAPQCLYEFYVVATRPVTANGFGWTSEFTLKEIQSLESLFPVLNDSDDLLETWKKLIRQFSVSGKTAHDTRLVAWMITHQISKLYTLNTADFQRYNSIIQVL